MPKYENALPKRMCLYLQQDAMRNPPKTYHSTIQKDKLPPGHYHFIVFVIISFIESGLLHITEVENEVGKWSSEML